MGARPSLAENYWRNIPRYLHEPQRLWQLSTSAGVVLGGVLVVTSGFLPWWEWSQVAPVSSTTNGADVIGVEFARGQVILALGAFLVALGLARSFAQAGRDRVMSAVVGSALAIGVIGLALVERDRGNPIDVSLNALWSGLYTLGEGYYFAFWGGIVALVCSLVAFIQALADRSPSGR